MDSDKNIKIFSLFFIVVVFGLTVNAQIIEFANPLGSGGKDIPTLIDKIATWLLEIGLVIAVIIILWAAFLFMTSGGNKERVTIARKTLLYAVIGITALLLARSVVPFVTNLLSGGAANTPAVEQTIPNTNQSQIPPSQLPNFPEMEESGKYGFSILDETKLSSPASDIGIPGLFPADEIEKLEDIRVENFNAYIDKDSFPDIGDQQKLKQIVGMGLDVFSDQYKNAALDIVILDENAYKRIQVDGYPTANDEQAKEFAESLATTDGAGLILINGDRILKGIEGLNSNGFNSIKASEDLFIHENAHAAMNKCNCADDWFNLKMQLLSEGKEDYGYVSKYAQEGGHNEDFAEMTVAYKNSGGNPSKIFPNSNQNLDREVLAKKFEFLRKYNIVR